MPQTIKSRIQDQACLNRQSPTLDTKAIRFPLDHYLELNKNKPKLLKEPGKKIEPFSKTQNLINQINNLAAEAEEKVKACIYEETTRPSPVFSPISLNESDSGYTEHLVETKFNDVTFQRPKGADRNLPQDLVEEKLNQLRIPSYNKINYNPIKYGRETFRSTIETMSSSSMPSKPDNQKKFNRTLYTTTKNPHLVQKSPTVTDPENKQSKHQPLKKRSPTTSHHCLCEKGVGREADSKQLKGTSEKQLCQNVQDKFLVNNPYEQVEGANWQKQYNDASVNTEPLSLRLNTHLINVISSHEQQSIKMNTCVGKLCQIQELPKVVIRPNFTKQIGPIIDIKTSKPLQKSDNVAVVECVHGGTLLDTKGNSPTSIVHDTEVDIVSQTVSPPAVHFKNSRDLKLLKVTKDLLGKLNFKDGTNVEKLKRSLTNLVSLLNQISPIHVANLRLTSFDTISASESIDTFFSNIDLVTEIIENELIKPTGRYCDYPECLIKAVDLLCGNIRSIFVIEDSRKKPTKPFETSQLGFERKKVKKPSLVKNRKQLRTIKNDIVERPCSVSSTIPGLDKDRSRSENSKYNPPDLYIPYRMLIPGGKHKAMEEAKNSQDIELRFKRLEKVLEINQSLKEAIPSQKNSLSDQFIQSLIGEERPLLKDDQNVLNETFIIERASDDDKESEMKHEKLETKTNKSEPDYEDDWELDSSKSDGGSMAMTEIIVAAQVHSSELLTSYPHSSSKKIPVSDVLSQELIVSSKGSQTENLVSSHSSSVNEYPLKTTDVIDTKMQDGKHLVKEETQGEVKDIENQHYIGKHATVHCEDIQKQTPKVEVIEPIAIPVEAPSFTVLRMTNPSTKSLLEVRFPEQIEKLKSSLTVQKSNNSEEIKLLYNMNNDEKIVNWKDTNDEFVSLSQQIPTEKNDGFYYNPSNVIGKHLPSAHNTEGLSSTKKIQELNDFQNITTNFIQFLESKVTEMVSKFKSSEVICEKLTNHFEQKSSQTSQNKYHICSSKASLKNEHFYKSASSLFSNRSNEDASRVRDSLSQRCTPDNQEIIPYENLTSPPLGLQLKESSKLNEAINSTLNTLYYSQNKDPKPVENQTIKLISGSCTLQKNNQNQISGGNSEKNNNDLMRNKIEEQMKSVLKEDEENRKPVFNGFHNRLLPLPEDVIINKGAQNGNEEKESFSTIIQNTLPVKQSLEVVESVISHVIAEDIMLQSLKSNERKSPEHLEAVPQTRSAIFEETMLALTSVEQTFENIDSNEESTAVLAKTPQMSSKNEDDLDSQRTSISHFANILPISEIRKASSDTSVRKVTSPITHSYEKVCSWPLKESNGNIPAEVTTSHQQQDIENKVQEIPIEKDFSKLLPFPDPNEEFQPDTKCSEIDSQLLRGVNIHTMFISGPSHIDEGLNSSYSLFKNSTEKLEQKLFDISTQMSSSANDAAIQTNCNKLYNSSSQTSPPPPDDLAIQISSNVLSEMSPPNDKKIETTVMPLNTESSDDCINLNYYNPEEMSDGEVGYVYTSNSYSSGEIKLCYEQNDDDSMTGPPTFREAIHKLPDHASSESNLFSTICKDKTHLKDSWTEQELSVLQNKPKKKTESSPMKSEKMEENAPEAENLSSSNDTTSTGELKNLFNAEDKIDEGLLGKLIDIHIRCSTRFSSESSGHIESVESMENKEEET